MISPPVPVELLVADLCACISLAASAPTTRAMGTQGGKTEIDELPASCLSPHMALQIQGRHCLSYHDGRQAGRTGPARTIWALVSACIHGCDDRLDDPGKERAPPLLSLLGA